MAGEERNCPNHSDYERRIVYLEEKYEKLLDTVHQMEVTGSRVEEILEGMRAENARYREQVNLYVNGFVEKMWKLIQVMSVIIIALVSVTTGIKMLPELVKYILGG